MSFPGVHRTHGPAYDGRLVRLNIGLEHVDDLTADLDRALRRAGWGERQPERDRCRWARRC